MKNTDIKNVYYNGNEVTSLYWGSNLIWETKFNYNNIFSGVLNDSVEESKIYYINTDYKKINFADKVNTETKEFNFEAPDFKFCADVNGHNFSSIYKEVTNIPLSKNDNSLTNKFAFISRFNYIDVSKIDKRKITKTNSMFWYCYVDTINFGEWDMKNVNVITNMFLNCGVKNVIGNLSNIGCNLSPNYSPNYLDLRDSPLTNESAMVFINGLSSTPISDNPKIRFSSTTYNTLTEEQIAIATSKGWTVTV